jgi:glutamate transport system substrate-binding protein
VIAQRTRRAGRIALATVGTALLATTLAACGGNAEPNASPSLVPGASSGGKLTIGIPFDEPGVGMKDGSGYTGFDVETATYVAKALGVPAENITFVEAEGDTRQQLLQSGGADLIVSTTSPGRTSSPSRTCSSGATRRTSPARPP